MKTVKSNAKDLRKGRIEIVDSRKRMFEYKFGAPSEVVKEFYISAFRVRTIAANGEILQTSETLNDKKAVMTHLAAMQKVYRSMLTYEQYLPNIVDATSKRNFPAFPPAPVNKTNK